MDTTYQKELIAQYSREIVRDYQLLMLINKKNAEQRIAVFLLELLVRMDLSLGREIDLNLCMSRADIANYLGLVPETVSRVLSKFERLGVLSVKKKKLHIVDEDLLVKHSTDQSLLEPLDSHSIRDFTIPLALSY